MSKTPQPSRHVALTGPSAFLAAVLLLPALGVFTNAMASASGQTTAATGSAIAGPTYDLKQLDRIPQARQQDRPAYPLELRSQGIAGEVVVGFVVDTEGHVRGAEVLRSSQSGFEAPAIDAVSRWTFRPGMKDGRAVNTRMSVPIVFRVSDKTNK